MIDRGANPFVVAHFAKDEIENYNLSLIDLSNLPTTKSIFFSTEAFKCFCDQECDSNLTIPWFYKNGIFDGQFDYTIGKGGSGIVVHGICHGVEAVYKFVDIGKQEFLENVSDALCELNRKLGEMRSIQATKGSKTLNFYGHYR